MEKKISIKTFVIVIAIILLAAFIKISGLGNDIVQAFADEYGNYSGDYGMYEYEYLYQTGNVDVDKNEVKYIMINWINGKIDIESYDGDRIKIVESFANETDGTVIDDNKMRYRIDNNQLKIQFTKVYSAFERIFTPPIIKDLHILLPKNNDNLDLLDIRSGNSPITVSNTVLNCARIENREGKITVNNCGGDVFNVISEIGTVNAANLNMKYFGVELESGKTDITKANLKSLHFTSNRASCVARMENAPQSMQLSSEKGDVTVYIPDNDGFSVTYARLHEEFNSDFPLEDKGDKMVYGDPKYAFIYDFHVLYGKASLLKAH